MQGQAAISEPELKQAYCHSVQSLKDYIAVSNLTSYDISGAETTTSCACTSAWRDKHAWYDLHTYVT